MHLLITLIFASASQAFTYDDLVALIQHRNLTKVEEVLPFFPEEMRSHFVLMKQSRSLQAATPIAPRAILFSPDGRLTCAFNGDPEQQGSDSLECIQFRDAERAFDFRQIVFPTSRNGGVAVQFSKRNLSANGRVACTACHALDPRPNWNEYNHWKGAFGEDDDNVDLEQDLFSLFRERSYKHPRYRWLIRELNSYAPYRLNGMDFEISHRPGLRLSETYGRLNAQRAARILAERLPAWERWAYAVSALHCELSETQRASLRNAGIAEKDLGLAKIFGELGLPPNQWTTQILADSPSYLERPWEHQTGLSMFTEVVAVAFLQAEAARGNTTLAHALQELRDYYSTSYYGDDRAFRIELAKIVPSPDYFATGYNQNRALVCPQATAILVAAVGNLRE